MAQHDMIIDNGPGAAVRADINAAVAALVSQSAGPVEPTTPYAFMFWMDTGVAPNVLRQRNAANSAWQAVPGTVPGGDAPSDNANYGRRNGAWEPTIRKSGDRMTGTLIVDSGELPTAALARQVSTYAVSVGTGIGWNGYINEPGTTWKLRTAGYLMTIGYTPSTGALVVTSSTAPGAAGADAPGFRNCVSMDPGGSIMATANVAAFGDPAFCMQGSGGLRTFQMTGGYGIRYESAMSIMYAGGASLQLRGADGALVASHAAWKPGGGPWADSSDARIKDVAGDYEGGLPEILALRPVRYSFKGNDYMTDPSIPIRDATDDEPAVMPRSSHEGVLGQEFIGLIAQEAETVMPEMVTLGSAFIDGEAVDDMRYLDPLALTFALINAVKALNARIEALESA